MRRRLLVLLAGVVAITACDPSDATTPPEPAVTIVETTRAPVTLPATALAAAMLPELPTTPSTEPPAAPTTTTSAPPPTTTTTEPPAAPQPEPAPTTTTTEAPTTTTEAPTTTTEAPTTTAAPEKAPEPSEPTMGGGWAQLRQCESGGNYAINTGNGYFGAYQFNQSTWDGAVARAGYPEWVGERASSAPAHVQDAAALQLYSERGAQPWPQCGRFL